MVPATRAGLGSRAKAHPATVARPESGRARPVIRRRVVDLPAPDPLCQGFPRLVRRDELFAVSAEGIDLGDVTRLGEIVRVGKCR
jgi:hypothetical protein